MERFWRKVVKCDCWEWIGARNTRGYGNFRLNGETLMAHRVAWELTRGTIPHGVVVCHNCDNPSCVNPNHLRLDTQDANVKEAWTKGRVVHYNRLKTECPRCGGPFTVRENGSRFCKECRVLQRHRRKEVHL